MNKNAIKNFAVSARILLIQAVTQKAFEYEVTENGKNDPSQAAVNGQSLTSAEQSQRAQLIAQIQAKGFASTMEEAAYTWFNRFIALRFMEVNNYLPSHTRIFSDEDGNFKPEVLTDAVNLEIDGLDKELVLELLEQQKNEQLYQYIVITQCNALNEGLPEMFERIGGWTELLFPKNLLREDSVIAHMVKDIPESDWNDQVQIIGWLYQYYNSEPKEKVFANLKKNVKISAADIPAATQLFTPDWIVRYMVENSLGRLWTEGHGKPENANWKYYLEEAEQEDSVKSELENLRAAYREIQPEQIKIIDPCMGSGHILVYAFDVLMDIYTACGWSERDAAKSILRNNLYGLDIDRRAYQLAYFAVMMKARQYNRRILSAENQPNLANFADVMHVNTSLLSGSLRKFAEQFQFADTYGSLMTVTKPAGLDEAVSAFLPTFGMQAEQLEMMMRVAQILTKATHRPRRPPHACPHAKRPRYPRRRPRRPRTRKARRPRRRHPSGKPRDRVWPAKPRCRRPRRRTAAEGRTGRGSSPRSSTPSRAPSARRGCARRAKTPPRPEAPRRVSLAKQDAVNAHSLRRRDSPSRRRKNAPQALRRAGRSPATPCGSHPWSLRPARA